MHLYCVLLPPIGDRFSIDSLRPRAISPASERPAAGDDDIDRAARPGKKARAIVEGRTVEE
ncbi:hypothetical protein SESBI_19467 [Sesbania bispinosa]|nr:hypothetical protein SESBI_19467 [Sesbania bispinosa]